VIKYILVRTCM